MGAAQPGKLNNQPLYLQAIDAIKAYIRRSGNQPGDMLPPEETLARELGISRLTLREAMGYLENDGFVERRRGVGTFVREPSTTHFAGGLERLETLRSLARVAGLTLKTSARDCSVVAATAEWAEGLEVPEQTRLARVRITQAIEGCLIASFDSLTPLDSIDVERLEASDGSLLEYFLDQTGCRLVTSRSLIFAEGASQDIARVLEVAEGTAVLHLIETYYLSNRRPVILSDNYFLTGRFNFYISRRAIHGSWAEP